MLVVHELEVRQGELGLQQCGELLLNRLGPLAHEHDELVDGPRHAPAGNLRVVALELRLQMLRLRPEELLELRSSLLTLGKVEVNFTLLSLNRSLVPTLWVVSC